MEKLTIKLEVGNRYLLVRDNVADDPDDLVEVTVLEGKGDYLKLKFEELTRWVDINEYIKSRCIIDAIKLNTKKESHGFITEKL